jgi:26S proteasome regulatory subunit N12
LQHNALIPSSQTPSQTLLTARSILESGALLSIRSSEPKSFIRYYSQLQPFYDSADLQRHPSQNRSKITGLYLLLLLSQGDYAGFHTLLETLIVGESSDDGKSVEDDPFIRYPVELERSLMEGSYDQVWRKTGGRDVPGEEFALFSDVSAPLCQPFYP